MSRTIYKYPIAIAGRQELDLPKGAVIRHVGLDPNNEPCIWCEVDPTEVTEVVAFWVHGTGHKISR